MCYVFGRCILNIQLNQHGVRILYFGEQYLTSSADLTLSKVSNSFKDQETIRLMQQMFKFT